MDVSVSVEKLMYPQGLTKRKQEPSQDELTSQGLASR